MSPEQLASTKWLEMHRGKVLEQKQLSITCWQSQLGTYIDYYVASPWVQHLLVGTGQDPTSPWGTHASVLTSLNLRPKSIQVTRRFVCRALPAVDQLPNDKWHTYQQQAEQVIQSRPPIPEKVLEEIDQHPQKEAMMILGMAAWKCGPQLKWAH